MAEARVLAMGSVRSPEPVCEEVPRLLAFTLASREPLRGPGSVPLPESLPRLAALGLTGKAIESAKQTRRCTQNATSPRPRPPPKHPVRCLRAPRSVALEDKQHTLHSREREGLRAARLLDCSALTPSPSQPDMAP